MRVSIKIKGAVRSQTLGQPPRPWVPARPRAFTLRPYGWTLWSGHATFNPIITL